MDLYCILRLLRSGWGAVSDDLDWIGLCLFFSYLLFFFSIFLSEFWNRQSILSSAPKILLVGMGIFPDKTPKRKYQSKYPQINRVFIWQEQVRKVLLLIKASLWQFSTKMWIKLDTCWFHKRYCILFSGFLRFISNSSINSKLGSPLVGIS